MGGGLPSANVALRKGLDLYAALRPVKSVPNVKTRYENVDLIVVRENTESLYTGLEHIVVPGVVESIKIITERASYAHLQSLPSNTRDGLAARRSPRSTRQTS